MEELTIIIPTYNRAFTIVQCIESVLNQSYPVNEIIVIDDNSTDDTIKLLNKFKENVIVLKTEKQSGAQTARNIGIKAAKSEWIAFLDSDDEWLPNKIEKQVSALKKVSYDPWTVVHGDCFTRNIAVTVDKFSSSPINSGDPSNTDFILLTIALENEKLISVRCCLMKPLTPLFNKDKKRFSESLRKLITLPKGILQNSNDDCLSPLITHQGIYLFPYIFYWIRDLADEMEVCLPVVWACGVSARLERCRCR